MNNPDILSAQDFQRNFADAYQNRLQELIILQEVGSTNDFLFTSDIPEPSKAIVCMAEQQTAGKGTKGRVWQSELGASFIYSIAYLFKADVKNLSALTLAIGVAIQQTLEDCGFAGVQLKWPNDLQYQYKKLGGVLVELKKVANNFHLVCGIGINVKSTLNADKIDQAFTSLATISATQVSRNQIAANLTENLLNLFSLYPQTGFENWQKQWQAVHAYQDKKIRVKQHHNEMVGVARGVGIDGALLLETENGLQKIISADVFAY